MSGYAPEHLHEVMKSRFEKLKRMYFANDGEFVDEDGETQPPLYTRKQIAEMFENMGVELPMTPNDQMKFITRRVRGQE